MSEHRWGENLWWPTEHHQQHPLHPQHQILQQSQQQQSQQSQQQAQHSDLAASVVASSGPATNHQQMFSYKMAGSGGGGGGSGGGFQENATTAVTAANYDYRLGGNQGVAQTQQWWYPHNNLDNALHQQSLQTVQNTPNNPQTDIRQQHQDEVHRHHQQQAAQQQQEAHQRHQQHQALAEAQARHQQQQQQLHQQFQQQLQQQQHHHQQQQNNHHHQQLLQHQVTTNKGRMPRAKGDARPRGRMTAYAFFVQTCREEHKKKHPDENVVFAEFSKKCAERWKTMLDKEKKRFHEMAEGDKKRYDDEMKNYTPPKGEKQRGKKRKQVKDPNAPKRSLSAFFWFSNDERGKVKGQNPQYGVGDIAKELGRRWADAEPEVKGKYEALADKDKARYEKEMTAYKKNNAAMQLAQQQAALQVPDNDDDEDEVEEADDDDDD